MAIPEPVVAARSAARLFVERRDLTPPVDVLDLLGERASVRRVDWPNTDVDAIITNLSATRDKPSIFLRATDNPLRERFTAAHELGHLLLPWHLPQANCATKEEEGALDRPHYTMEDEADVFASCVLVPDRWLADLLEGSDHDMGAVLRELNAAEVSTTAAIQALRRYVLAGWAFVAYKANRLYTTPGTVLPDSIDRHTDSLTGEQLNHLAGSASEHGSALLNGFQVKWFRFSQSSPLPLKSSGEGRSDHQILLDAITSCGYPLESASTIMHSANGKVGGSLRAAAGRPADELYDAMRHRLDDWAYSKLLSQPDFLLWLAQRCRGIEEKKRHR